MKGRSRHFWHQLDIDEVSVDIINEKYEAEDN